MFCKDKTEQSNYGKLQKRRDFKAVYKALIARKEVKRSKARIYYLQNMQIIVNNNCPSNIVSI